MLDDERRRERRREDSVRYQFRRQGLQLIKSKALRLRDHPFTIITVRGDEYGPLSLQQAEAWGRVVNSEVAPPLSLLLACRLAAAGQTSA